MEEERALVEAARKDPAQFARLYEANFERVYVFVSRRVGNRHDAEDLTSEVFHHALANLAKFEWRGVPFAVWLFRIAANLMVDRWKKISREAAGTVADDLDQSQWPEIERRATLFRLVDKLPADQRTVLIQRFVERKSIREIARELSRSEGAIKQLQYRGLETLREHAGGGHE